MGEDEECTGGHLYGDGGDWVLGGEHTRQCTYVLLYVQTCTPDIYTMW